MFNDLMVLSCLLVVLFLFVSMVLVSFSFKNCGVNCEFCKVCLMIVGSVLFLNCVKDKFMVIVRLV